MKMTFKNWILVIVSQSSLRPSVPLISSHLFSFLLSSLHSLKHLLSSFLFSLQDLNFKFNFNLHSFISTVCVSFCIFIETTHTHTHKYTNVECDSLAWFINSFIHLFIQSVSPNWNVQIHLLLVFRSSIDSYEHKN